MASGIGSGVASQQGLQARMEHVVLAAMGLFDRVSSVRHTRIESSKTKNIPPRPFWDDVQSPSRAPCMFISPKNLRETTKGEQLRHRKWPSSFQRCCERSWRGCLEPCEPKQCYSMPDAVGRGLAFEAEGLTRPFTALEVKAHLHEC